MHARWTRRLFNLYPPFVGAGVHVTDISADWRHLRVRMPLRWYNRNYVGTHFGGSLYSMTDPFLMIMVMKNLGPDYVVWDKTAEIEFVAPGRGAVTADFTLTDAQLDHIRSNAASGKHLPWFQVDVKADDGTIVARVRKQLYVRRRQAPGTGPGQAAGLEPLM
jgi:acyl-coenzyme A thioesterase PaaI-like protein